MKRATGWVLLGVMWFSVAIRCFVFPYDLHGDYPAAIHTLNLAIDLVLVMPPWLILQRVITPPEAPWAFWSITALYLFALSALIYLVFMRKTTGGHR